RYGHGRAVRIAPGRAARGDAHRGTPLEAHGTDDLRVGDAGIEPGRLVVVLVRVRLGHRICARDAREPDRRYEPELVVRARRDAPTRAVAGAAHGNGWGSVFRSASARSLGARPAARAAVQRRAPPRSLARCDTSSAQSSGATTRATLTPSSATSGDVTSTANAETPWRTKRSHTALICALGVEPSSGGTAAAGRRSSDASRNDASSACSGRA